MRMITQKARRRQGVVKLAKRKGNTFAAKIYGVGLSSVKRWCKQYDGTWQSLAERSHRPHSHPKQHTAAEERQIREQFDDYYCRYGWEGLHEALKARGYTRSLSGMKRATKRMGLPEPEKARKPPRKHNRRYPELTVPGEKVQIDVKEVPYCCLRGKSKRDGKRLYQWTAIDEATRLRLVYGYEEHTPENSVDFMKRLIQVFPFKIQTVQTDNGTEFTYKFISETELCPFDKYLQRVNIVHKLIPPRTPWHNGKVERSHRNDQRYFYDWEWFKNVGELNERLRVHLRWSNHKVMRTLGWKSPLQRLQELLSHPAPHRRPPRRPHRRPHRRSNGEVTALLAFGSSCCYFVDCAIAVSFGPYLLTPPHPREKNTCIFRAAVLYYYSVCGRHADRRQHTRGYFTEVGDLNRIVRGGKTFERSTFHGSRINEAVAGSRGALWASDPAVEPQDGTVYLYGAQRDLHHRPA